MMGTVTSRAWNTDFMFLFFKEERCKHRQPLNLEVGSKARQVGNKAVISSGTVISQWKVVVSLIHSCLQQKSRWKSGRRFNW